MGDEAKPDAVAWRWKFKDATTWGGVDPTEPNSTQWRSFDVEPLYPASALTALREENERLGSLLSDFLPPRLEWKERDVDSVIVHHKISVINRARAYLRDRSAPVKSLVDRATAAETEAATLRDLLTEAVKALEPFALVITEGVAKCNDAYASVTTCTDYFRDARDVSAKIKEMTGE